ncbi:hypothetical protein PMI15_03038 [Polaromonas sp. CF318]|uniref:hypothetical protein n=1 Tax=Polaromonas sp. CF318 TaxID=1144318 RepID=UPI000270E338|nr:hypothetical protein [Polaromonas sp. CF318]EJL82435.1 hypothetical protein PMI15_03038 [Polaromonas sp. CF318]
MKHSNSFRMRNPIRTHNRFAAAWVYIHQALITCVEVLRLGVRDARATLRHRAN